MRSLFLVALVVLFGAFAVFAQTDRGAITGTVSDPAAAVVAAALVELRNAETGVQYTGQTSGTGNFTFTQLQPGNYDLTVSVAGFKKAVQKSILVQVTQTTRVDLTLEVGSSAESVTVTAEVSL